jgi:cytochrome P450
MAPADDEGTVRVITEDAAPVGWDAEHGVYRVTGFEEASTVLRGPGWSSDPANSPLAPPELAQLPSSIMLFTDPPDHTRLRRLVAPAFSARAVAALRARVAAIVDACLDGIAADLADGETVDLVADLGYLVPLAVIAELLDVGSDGAEAILDQTPALARLLEVDAGPAELAGAVGASLEVTMLLTPLLAARRDRGGGDFVSALLAVDGLELDEVLATCILLLAAGHETTANLIANGALALIRDPGQVPALLADPARAVEELIRREGPVRLIGRTALVDQTLAGVPIPAGSQVIVDLPAANADPRRFPDGSRLDLTRTGPGHLGFGAGIHFCLGAALARIEAEEALVRLFTRLPGLVTAGDPVARRSGTFHALESLPVRLG